MRKIFRNYTAERPVRSVVNERSSPPIYRDKDKIFSRGVVYPSRYIDDLEKETKESDNAKSSLKNEIKKRILIKKKIK